MNLDMLDQLFTDARRLAPTDKAVFITCALCRRKQHVRPADSTIKLCYLCRENLYVAYNNLFEKREIVERRARVAIETFEQFLAEQPQEHQARYLKMQQAYANADEAKARELNQYCAGLIVKQDPFTAVLVALNICEAEGEACNALRLECEEAEQELEKLVVVEAE